MKIPEAIHGCSKDQEIAELKQRDLARMKWTSDLAEKEFGRPRYLSRPAELFIQEGITELKQRITDLHSKIDELERKNRLIAEREESDMTSEWPLSDVLTRLADFADDRFNASRLRWP